MKPWLALALGLLLPLQVLADGKVFAPLALPVPTIPDQRALICYSNGTQRLVIETRFSGAGTNFAWVLPLPARPVIEPATTGLFPTLSHLFQPRVVNAPPRYYLLWVGLLGTGFLVLSVRPGKRLTGADFAASVLIVAATAAASPPAGFLVGVFLTGGVLLVRYNQSTSVTLLLMIGLGLLLGAMLLPSLGRSQARGISAGPGIAGVSILDRQIIGSFETVTIESRDPRALTAWLEENGFGLPANAQRALDHYVSNHWVFVATKLHRPPGPTAQATNTPHPLSFTFSTTNPVYPLRLTGIDNGPLTLELFVFGPERARLPGFKTERAAKPQYAGAQSPSGYWRPGSRLTIAHPTLREWTTSATVGTKLTATLAPQQMRQDAYLEWVPFQEKETTLYSTAAARTVATNWGALILLLGAVFTWIVGTSTPRRYLKMPRMLWASVIIAMLASLTVYFALPRTEVRVAKSRPWTFRENLYDVRIRWMGSTSNPFPSLTTARLAAAAVLAEPPEHRGLSRENLLLGGPIREEDSPGNYLIRERDGRAEFVEFDYTGAEQVHVSVPIATPPRP